jgi:uncharacterized protein YbbC (DUF1343 family)
VHVTDREEFETVRTAVSLINVAAHLYPEHFAWRLPEGAEALKSPVPFVDLLWGSDTLRRTIDAGGDPADLIPLDPKYPAGTTRY